MLDVRSSTAEILAGLLSDVEHEERARFKTDALSHRYAAAHGLLRAALGRLTGVDPRRLEMTRRPCRQCGRPHGKPILAGARDETNIFFNLSHSGNLAGVAVSRTAEVGIDIEQHAHINLLSLEEATLAPVERAALRPLSKVERECAFFDIWCRKEALLKAIGLGVTYELPSLSMVGRRGSRLAAEVPGQEGRWTVQDLDIGGGYSGAVAIAGSRLSVRLSHWDATGLASPTQQAPRAPTRCPSSDDRT